MEFLALSSVLVNFDRPVFDQRTLPTVLTLKGTEGWKNLEFKGAISLLNLCLTLLSCSIHCCTKEKQELKEHLWLLNIPLDLIVPLATELTSLLTVSFKQSGFYCPLSSKPK